MPLLLTTSVNPFLLNFDLREPYFLLASDPSTNFFARPPCSNLTFKRPPFADHPRAFLSSGDYSTALFWTTPTRLDLQETWVTTFTFLPRSLFLLGPCSPPQICFVMRAYCFLFPCSICFYVLSSSACIHLIFSSSLGSISSALALPVSRGRHGNLIDNFSQESDVTSLQDQLDTSLKVFRFIVKIAFIITRKEIM